jgi:hypothetical protein
VDRKFTDSRPYGEISRKEVDPMSTIKARIYGTAAALTAAATLGVVPLTASAATPNGQACWGQATKVFAATGELGQHASSEPTPRLGLANLARALFAQGVIPAPTMQALGAFVAAQLGLSIDACM